MKFLLLIPVIALGVIVGLSVYLQPNDFIGCDETPAQSGECAPADAIVVVSGGDTSARTAAGIDLYRRGWADTLIFSGAALDTTGPSNAAAMRAQALESGVPAEAIQVDETSRTTQENAENTQSIFAANDHHRVILVTSGYHQRRASLEFERRAEGVTIMNYPVTHDSDWSAWWWLTPRGWWLAGGEMVKIVVSSVEGAVTQ